MTRSKKVFLGVMLLFFFGLILMMYDISRKTTFPGSKSKLNENQLAKPSDGGDTSKSNLSPKSAIHQP